MSGFVQPVGIASTLWSKIYQLREILVNPPGYNRVRSELADAAYLVARDVRDASDHVIHERNLGALAEVLAGNPCIRARSTSIGHGHVSVSLYRYEVVQAVLDHQDSLPHGPVRDWILGKLFGYSTKRIQDYVDKAKQQGD